MVDYLNKRYKKVTTIKFAPGSSSYRINAYITSQGGYGSLISDKQMIAIKGSPNIISRYIKSIGSIGYAAAWAIIGAAIFCYDTPYEYVIVLYMNQDNDISNELQDNDIDNEISNKR